MSSTQDNKRYPYRLLVFVLSFVVFINTFQNDFTMDDNPTILENKAVTGADIIEVLSSSRAVRQLSFMIDYKIFGNNPLGYHVENALLHAINSVLLCELLVILSFSATSAFTAGLIFAVHPIHVEAVAGIANRKELLALLFILLSTICYVQAAREKYRQKKVAWSIAAIFFYIIATFSKQTAALLPFVIIVYDYTFIDKKNRLIGKIALPLTICISIYIIYDIIYPSLIRFFSKPETMNVSYKQIILTVISVFSFDLKYLTLPFQLSADHTIELVKNISSPIFIVSLLLLTSYCLAAWLSFKHAKPAFFVMAWVVIFLLPTVNLVPGISYFFAERYLYIPSVGYAALMGRLFDVASDAKRGSSLSIVLLCLTILLFSYSTISRNAVWQNEFTLWKDTAYKSPKSLSAHNNLGNVYYLKGEFKGAINEYEEALRLNPDHPESLYNLGNIYYETGDKDKALYKYKGFLRVWKGDKQIQQEVASKVQSLEE